MNVRPATRAGLFLPKGGSMRYRVLMPILRNGDFFEAGAEIELAADVAATLPVEPIEPEAEEEKPKATKSKSTKPSKPRASKPKKAGGK